MKKRIVDLQRSIKSTISWNYGGKNLKKNYKKIEFYAGCDIAMAVHKLLEYKDKGEYACGEFNGHMLYSDNVRVDSAYLEITGKTKADFDKEREEWRQDYERREQEHKAKIPELSTEWIDRGHNILDEKYWVEWDKCVPIRLGDLYHGMELGNCLDIVEALNNNCNLDEAKKIIDGQDHSGMSYGLVRVMVKSFCDRGEEFYTYTG